jgi:HrpA-like RNA helicase
MTYLSLHQQGFSHSQIQTAFSAITSPALPPADSERGAFGSAMEAMARILHAASEWLCIELPPAELPPGWTSNLGGGSGEALEVERTSANYWADEVEAPSRANATMEVDLAELAVEPTVMNDPVMEVAEVADELKPLTAEEAEAKRRRDNAMAGTLALKNMLMGWKRPDSESEEDEEVLWQEAPRARFDRLCTEMSTVTREAKLIRAAAARTGGKPVKNYLAASHARDLMKDIRELEAKHGFVYTGLEEDIEEPVETVEPAAPVVASDDDDWDKDSGETAASGVEEKDIEQENATEDGVEFDVFAEVAGADGETAKKAEVEAPKVRRVHPSTSFEYNSKWSGLSPRDMMKQFCMKNRSFGRVIFRAVDAIPEPVEPGMSPLPQTTPLSTGNAGGSEVAMAQGKEENLPLLAAIGTCQLKLLIYRYNGEKKTGKQAKVKRGQTAAEEKDQPQGIVHEFTMRATECCATQEEAENFVSTRAMYRLQAGTQLYLRLPPPFKELWLSWDQAERDAKEDAIKAAAGLEDQEHLRRLEFLHSLLPQPTEGEMLPTLAELLSAAALARAVREVEPTAMEVEEAWVAGTELDDVPAIAPAAVGGNDGWLDEGESSGGEMDGCWEDLDIDSPKGKVPPPAKKLLRLEVETKEMEPEQEPEPEPQSQQTQDYRHARAEKRADLPERIAKDWGDAPIDEASMKVWRHLEELIASPKYEDMLLERQELPVFQHRDLVINTIRDNQVVLISGETGSGKTTQVPQFLLEDMIFQGEGAHCNIIVTQPRRISAVGVAERVANEMGQACGQRQSLCGYQIRMESTKTAHTRLLYCTTGILLRQLQSNEGLPGVSHVIIDEVHERTMHSDFLMVLLKRLLQKQRKDLGNRHRPLKLILMSATMNAQELQRYFNEADFACPVVTIPGRTFPVQHHFLEGIVDLLGRRPEEAEDKDRINMDLLEKLLLWLDGAIAGHPDTPASDLADEVRGVEGAILVFMPGLAAIKQLDEVLKGSRVFGNRSRYMLFPLHSSLAGGGGSNKGGPTVFSEMRPGVRKLVIATNIAETGITIPDVVFVIDTGRMKQVRHNSRNKLSSLKEIFVARANAKQRAGRAGRVRPGFCFRLYSETLFQTLPDHWQPEMQRMPLEELCLHIMDSKLGTPFDILTATLTPPMRSRIQDAMSNLVQVGAVKMMASPAQQQRRRGGAADKEPGYTLEPLGRVMARLPVDPQMARMAVFGALLGMLDPALVIAAATSCTKSVFISLDGIKLPDVYRRTHSDHLAVYYVYRAWRSACRDAKESTQRLMEKGGGSSKSFCARHVPALHEQTLLEIQAIKTQIAELLRDAGFGDANSRDAATNYDAAFDTPAALNVNSANLAVLKAGLAAGLYPGVVAVRPKQDGQGYAADGTCTYSETRHHKEVFMHPASLNHGYRLAPAASLASSNASPSSAQALTFDSEDLSTTTASASSQSAFTTIARPGKHL